MPGGIDFLREVFQERGAVSGKEVEAAWADRMIEVTCAAVLLVERDIRRTTKLRDARVRVWAEDDLVIVTLNGDYKPRPVLDSPTRAHVRSGRLPA